MSKSDLSLTYSITFKHDPCLNPNDLSTFLSNYSMAGLPSNAQRHYELLAETPYQLTSFTDEQEGNFSNICILAARIGCVFPNHSRKMSSASL